MFTEQRCEEGRAITGKGLGWSGQDLPNALRRAREHIGPVHRVSVNGSPYRWAYFWKVPNGSRATAKVCRRADRGPGGRLDMGCSSDIGDRRPARQHLVRVRHPV